MLTGGLLTDTMESYTVGATVNGLNQGTGWCKKAPYTDRNTYLGTISVDDMESYTVGQEIATRNGGTGWPAAYGGDNIFVSILNSKTVITGSTGSFYTFPIVGGAPPFTYQWFRNGSPLSNGGDISGADTATLSIANWQNFYDGNFVLQVTDNVGRVFTSNTCAAASTSSSNAWGLQVVTNGGSLPSAASMNAVSDFLSGLNQDGTDSLMISAVGIAPDSLTAALTPMIKTAGNALWTNHNFVSGDLTVNGLAGNGSTKYLQTGLITNTCGVTVTDGVLAMYDYTKNSTSQGVELGNYDGGGANTWSLLSDYQAFGFHVITDFYAFATARITAASPGNGFYITSRTSATAMDLYFASSSVPFVNVGSNAGAAGVLNATELTAFAQNVAGVAQGFSNAVMSFICVAHGLTAAQAQNLYNRVQILRTAFGGGFR
jgi:hypothetical protein